MMDVSNCDVDAKKLTYNYALYLLANREHSRLELERKLLAKGYLPPVVAGVLTELAAKNLQSDLRFAESYVNMRKNRGFGPYRITAELQERGVAAEVMQQVLYSPEIDWLALAIAARHKKFGSKLPRNYAEQVKQKKYLQYKGFGFDTIQQVMTHE